MGKFITSGLLSIFSVGILGTMAYYQKRMQGR